ncbi:hypothetical protein ACOSQ2_018177 [Xanthoceras sorbifolium]
MVNIGIRARLRTEEKVSLLMVCHTKEKTHQNLWYLDTSCNNHMYGNKNAFSDLDESFQNTVKFIDESTGNSTHSISNVFFVPDLKTNLFNVVDYFWVFGCIAYAHIADEKRKKLDDKGEKCIFLGVSDQSKAYKLYNPITKKIVISRDVVFDEERTWSHDTIRLVVTLAAQNSWPIYQLDVKSAFLHGELQEQVFINQPPGYVKFGCEHKVYQLKKALSGLKQVPRAWFSRINAYF